MRHYIALLHRDADSSYGVSFPDIPGVIAAADTLDEAIAEASDVLAFAAADWEELTGEAFPTPRSLEELRTDRTFLEDSLNAVIAAIPFQPMLRAA